MWRNIFRFFSLLFTTIVLGAGLSHAFAFANKMKMSAPDYLVAQQVFRGWSYVNMAVTAAIATTLILTILVYRYGRRFFITLMALLCEIGAQAIFWLYTFPANRETNNWTFLPDNWTNWRHQWEYSYLANAGLNLIAFILLLIAIIMKRRKV